MNSSKNEYSPENLPSPVTMQMVAEKAGLSRSTVSYALRNNPNIAYATRVRVQAIAKEMGYRRNAYVSTLMAQVHGKRISSEQPAIAWIVDQDIAHMMQEGFHGHVLKGAKERANQLGYFIEVFVWDDASMSTQRLGHILRSRGIRGVVFAPVSFEHQDFSEFPFSNFACSSIGYSLRTPRLHRVGIDYSQGMRLIWSKIEEKGYRSPGLILSNPYDERTDYLNRGVFIALQSRKDIKQIPPCMIPHRESVNCKEVRSWLMKYLPDMIVCCVPQKGIYETLNTMSVDYKPTLFVINQDKVSPESGTVQPDVQIGYTAVDLVVNQIHRGEQGIPETPSTTLIPYTWVDAAARADCV